MNTHPPYGLCLPATVVRVIDGDTLVVSFGSERKWHVRLIDCWCAERNTEEGKRAKKTAEEFVKGKEVSVYIPVQEDPKNLLSEILSMGRVLGHVYVDERTTLAHLLVTAGVASKEKTR